MPLDYAALPVTSITDVDSRELNTGGWRTMRPVWKAENCTWCNLCWKFCPDICIFVEQEGVRIDYDHCKGCGICAYECPRDAIEMVLEVES